MSLIASRNRSFAHFCGAARAGREARQLIAKLTLIDAINLARKLDSFSEHWAPRVVATMNDYEVMVVRVEGEFVWHSHPDTDDLFLVLDGELEIELRDAVVTLGPGELYVVPKVVEHRPVARRGEVRMLLIEPKGTPNTGDPATAVAKTNV